MLNISSGRISRAQKVVIYGAEGIGKSTLESHFPNPLFIDTEGGTSHMDVRRIEKPEDVLSKDEEVEAKIIDIDPEKQKVSLSIRALLNDDE